METYEVRETVTEDGWRFPVHYLRRCTIKTEHFYGSPKEYQTETWFRNGQRVKSGVYPARTEYAVSRLTGTVRVS